MVTEELHMYSEDKVMNGRRVMLVYPPVSSPWHWPVGIAWLTAVLLAAGHSVLQRFGHLLGLEYVLRTHGGHRFEDALAAIRNPDSDIVALHTARMTLEEISRSIPTEDLLLVERNNVRYVPDKFDGTLKSLLAWMKNPEASVWYEYLSKVEVPAARVFNPDVYGISINDERQLVPGCILAALIKAALPDAYVVMGGNFWARMEHVFQLPEFTEMFDFCDAVVYAEGFEPIKWLAETLAPCAPGIVRRVVHRGEQRVVVNPKGGTASSFETLPTPHFDGGADMWGPEQVYPLYTTSNCPLQCSYCGISGGSDTFLQRPRLVSASRIARHMATLAGESGRFDFFDETFQIGRQIALGDALHTLGMSATWQCYLTATQDMLDPARCKKLYDAGCRAVQLGLESLSDETLARENKRWNHPHAYGQILRNLHDAGIQVHVFVMVGIPGEKVSDTLRWIPFVEEYGQYILTIKVTRYRLTRTAPEEREETHSRYIEVLPDTAVLHLNREFRYKPIGNQRPRKRAQRSPALHSVLKDVEAARTLLEEMCRRHWAYSVTSTLPWWTNRGRYSLEQLREMAQALSMEPETPRLREALRRAKSFLEAELGVKAEFESFEELAAVLRAHVPNISRADAAPVL